ncbi:chondroitin sulfate glucuronyltransferase [Onthophagus taurus]|uniref:chondroitin sulfate glucuronyltransferase n=1 Tax=Onthophagus taurus TaxID=166361 RepID=UPI000C204DCE|nr:chondroitin sulfate glucuronyltransferase [Onthophagus taurus]
MLKYSLRIIHNNCFLLLGICVGLLIPLNFEYCAYEEDNAEVFGSVEAVLKVQNITRRQVETKLVRPRYYSTELGIKDKLFVGVISSEDRILTQAVHVNKTIEHIVDKTKFFITATQNFKNKFYLSGIVGFTDTRRVFRPFQIIKYIGDSFDDYDYYFLMNDYNYLDARRLKEIVNKISVSNNVYLGGKTVGSFCSLESGILFSNSVVKAMIENLDWCIKNVISADDSENLGRCVYYSTKLTCQISIQDQKIQSFKLNHFDLNEKLFEIKSEVMNSVTVYPILNKNDFYTLHAFFSKNHLKGVKSEMDLLTVKVDSWPSGRRNGTKPLTRFDLPNTIYFNRTHNFFPDHFNNIQKFTTSESEDIEKILEVITKKAPSLKFLRLINGYKKFQLSRGVDYSFDLKFLDLKTNKEVIKRYEVCKPLGNVEFLTKPYTTENTKIFILVPVHENELNEAYLFLNNFVPNVMDKRDKIVLMFVLLYGYDSSNRGETDVFKKVKELAVEISRRYHSEDTKAAWISIRLPNNEVKIGSAPSLKFGIVDLSLRKIGLDGLILYLDVYAQVNVEFLNRVRMNTIDNFQTFSAIPFRQYNPLITKIDRVEVHKNVGQFDKEEFDYVSFYGRDYVKARKLHELKLPIVRVDEDLINIIDEDHKRVGNIYEMFLEFSEDQIHNMRATDAALFVRYHEKKDRNNLFLGNKAQLAKVILDKL